jgi:hypothetical protein
LKIPTAHYFHITKICTICYLFFDIPNCSLCSQHHSFHIQLLVLLTQRTANCVHITTICTIRYLFYWQPEKLIMFISTQFALSVTCSIDTTNCTLCSYNQSLNSQLNDLLKSRNYHDVHITTVCTVRYFFYWHSLQLIMFTSPEFAQSDNCSSETLNCSLYSHHLRLHIQLLVLLKPRKIH